MVNLGLLLDKCVVRRHRLREDLRDVGAWLIRHVIQLVEYFLLVFTLDHLLDVAAELLVKFEGVQVSRVNFYLYLDRLLWLIAIVLIQVFIYVMGTVLVGHLVLSLH